MNSHVNEKALAAAMEPLLDELFKLEKRLDDIQMVEGPKGEQGEKGLDADPDLVADIVVSKHGDKFSPPGADEVADLLAKGYADLLRGDTGADGKDADPEKVADSLYNSPEFLELVKGEKGADGADADVQAVAKSLVDLYGDQLRGVDGRDGNDGKDGADAHVDYDALAIKVFTEYGEQLRGKDADPVEIDIADVAKEVISDADFICMVKGAPGEKGEPGPAGEKGADGLDRYTVSPVHINDDDVVDKGTTIYWDGGLFQAIKKAQGSPAKDPGAYKTIVNGVDAISGSYDAENRQHILTCSLSDGEQFKTTIDDLPRYRTDLEGVLIKGDFHFDGKMLKVWDGSDWDEHDISGPRGEKGEKGERGGKGRIGKQGVGIDDVLLDGSNVVFLLTDGNPKSVPLDTIAKSLSGTEWFKEFLLDIVDNTQEDIDQEIKRYAGNYVYDTPYKAGDVVTTPQGLYLALKNNSETYFDKDRWVQMHGTAAGTLIGGGGAASGISLPVDQTRSQTYRFDATTGQMGWVDSRTSMSVVNNIAELSSRAALPVSELSEGKLVYVLGTHQLYELVMPVRALTNSMTDWKEVGSGGVKYSSRIQDLPNARSNPPPSDGQTYVVRIDFEGQPYNRMVTWDAAIPGAPAKSTVQPLLFQGTDRLFNGADYTGIVGAGPVNPGRWYLIDVLGGITPAAGEPYAGVNLPLGTKLIDLGNVQKGRNGWTVAPPDPNFAVGGTPALPAPQVVDDLAKARLNGGWRFINRETYVNPLATDPDHPLDNRKGDFQTVTELNNKVLKVYDGNSWSTLFDEQQIKGWIASLAKFRGTISEDPTLHVGTITWNNLPDLTALSAAKDKTVVGRYWIWAGLDPFTVVAPTGGTGGTPEIGQDLAGAILHVGDWLVIADQGNGIAGDPNEVDLRWVRVGGDLLTKSRGTNLFGLKDWVAGTWERDSLVTRNGAVYRAQVGVVPGDVAPDFLAGATAPRIASAFGFASVAAGTPLANDADLNAILAAGRPPQWTAYQIGADFNPTGAVHNGNHFTNGFYLVWTGFPNWNYTDATHIVDQGWMIAPDTVFDPANGNPGLNVDAAMLAALRAIAPNNPWAKVNIGGAIKFAGDETGLPAAGSIGESYLILTSPTYGGGNPAIVTWDVGSSQWVVVSGGQQQNPMNLMVADDLVGVGCPIGTIIMWASTTIPNGWLALDGQTFDPLVYPELATLFPTNAVPDLRNNFVRMWGPGHPLNLNRQQWTTGAPRNQFITSTSGAHSHHITANVEAGIPGPSYAAGGYHMGPSHTDHDGDHSHAITGGGDPETAPDHVVLGMLIKAKEGTARLRNVP